jgi:SAM-dependent methyltransferase
MNQPSPAWVPHFACPECGGDVTTAGGADLACAACGRAFARRDEVWRFLTTERAAQLERFVRQYRVVRERDGYRAPGPDYYRKLPSVAAGDPQAGRWQIRRETYHHLLGHVLAAGPLPLHILDLGAGSAWLSHRLASLGHRAVAVDAIDDVVDGLGAARNYVTKFPLVQADFDALPFAPGQFDLVIFNGALHYAPDTAATLERAHRMLAPGGALVVMDSPMFRADHDGSAMVGDVLRRFTVDCGLTDAVQQGIGYLTFTMLAAIAERLQLHPQFVPSRGPLGWRLRRHLARVRLRRSPAAFGLWVAR